MISKILILTMSFSAFSRASELKKTIDVGVAKCDELSDIGSRTFRLSILTETQTSTTRDIEMNLELLKCQQNSDRGFDFQPTYADEVLLKKMDVPEKGIMSVKSTLISLNIDALSQDGKLLTQGRILELAQGQYTLSFRDIDINQKDAIITSKFVEEYDLQDSEKPQTIDSIGVSYLLNFN